MTTCNILFYRGFELTMATAKKTDWLNTLLPLAGIGAIIVVAYVVIKSFFTAGGDAFMNQYKLMYEEYVKKIDQYGKESNGALTQAQLASKDGEEKLMGDVLGKAQAAYNNPYAIIGTLGTIIVAVWAAVYILQKFPSIIAKYRYATVYINPPKTAKGAAAIYGCALIDAYAADGQTVLATNLLGTLQNYWSTVDVPAMQSIISTYQNQINQGILTGYQLAFAQYIVQAYQYEIAIMPTYFAGIII